MIKNFVYFIKEALRGFYQAKMMTFVSVMTIGFALFFMGVFAVAYLNIRSWFNTTSNRVEVVAFIKDSALSDSAGVREILSRIRACSQVANATYVDKKTAWERFKGAYGTAMLSAVDDNPFPASVEISLVQSAQSTAATEELQNLIQEIPGIEDIQISRQWVKLLQRFKTYFFVATFAIGLVLIFALHFMIANTIKLTIYISRCRLFWKGWSRALSARASPSWRCIRSNCFSCLTSMCIGDDGIYFFCFFRWGRCSVV